MTISPGQLLDRLAAARQLRERELAENRRALTTAADRLGAPFGIGDRVFDTITGGPGRIDRVDPGATPGSFALIVALDAGPLVTRDPSQLIDRPNERAARPPGGASNA